MENTPPKAISRAEGCKLPRGAYFPIHPDSRQCIAILFSRAGVYWKLPFIQPGCIELTVYKFNILQFYKKKYGTSMSILIQPKTKVEERNHKTNLCHPISIVPAHSAGTACVTALPIQLPQGRTSIQTTPN